MTWGILLIVFGLLFCLSRVSPNRYFQGGSWGKANLMKISEQNYDLQKRFEKTKIRPGYVPSLFYIGIVLIAAGVVVLFLI